MSLKPLAVTPESSNSPRHWRAQLDLVFAEMDKHTRFAYCEHIGPLRVQRLFYPDTETHSGKAHCYLLHPPGGVVLGDELQINVTLRSGNALLTTPSAGRFYTVESHVESQRQTVNLHVQTGCLEWLPQETILFNGVNAELTTRIDLEEHAQLAFWDVVVLGRPACGERFTQGQLRQSLAVYRSGRPILSERLALFAGDTVSSARMGLQGRSTIGIMVLTLTLARDALDRWLEEVNDGSDNGDFTATTRTDLLIARYLGEDAQRCRAGFAILWRTAVAEHSGSAPATPRIWHT